MSPAATWNTETAPRRPLARDTQRVVRADGAVLHLPDVPTGPGGNNWKRDGRCGETDPEAFFPHPGGSARQAKRVCAACPVQRQCLDYALRLDVAYGVWGGTTPGERRRIRRGKGAA